MRQISLVVLLAAAVWAPGCRLPSVRRLGCIDAIVAEEMAAGQFPGAVVLVGRRDRVLYCKAFGAAMIEPAHEPMHRDTIFDLASMTKPIATATSILILADRGQLSVDDPVGAYLPAFASAGKEDARIRHLLTHTSGLPAYTTAKSLADEHGSPCPEAVIEKTCRMEAMNVPGEEFRYSCLGYIVLARIVETVSGRDVAEFSKENIFEPLGMNRTAFNPPASWQDRIAPTQIVDGTPLRGTVHDPLAQLMDGVSGNAGLFSTASDLSIFCRMLLNGGVWRGQRILSPDAVRMLTTAQSHGRAYGFDVNSDYAWLKGPNASERAFCHTGYTGTSIVCDPAVDTYVVILTNRAHPHDKGTVRALRLRIAEAVFPPSESAVTRH
jgi:CubicO group peptidase (beta-lactamase class C family)